MHTRSQWRTHACEFGFAVEHQQCESPGDFCTRRHVKAVLGTSSNNLSDAICAQDTGLERASTGQCAPGHRLLLDSATLPKSAIPPYLKVCSTKNKCKHEKGHAHTHTSMSKSKQTCSSRNCRNATRGNVQDHTATSDSKLTSMIGMSKKKDSCLWSVIVNCGC